MNLDLAYFRPAAYLATPKLLANDHNMCLGLEESNCLKQQTREYYSVVPPISVCWLRYSSPGCCVRIPTLIACKHLSLQSSCFQMNIIKLYILLHGIHIMNVLQSSWYT